MSDSKYDVTADLFMKMNSIPCEHFVVNPNIDSPYDHYINFLGELHKHYSSEQISDICKQCDSSQSPSINGTIPPSLVSTLAFSRLEKLVRDHQAQLSAPPAVQQPPPHIPSPPHVPEPAPQPPAEPAPAPEPAPAVPTAPITPAVPEQESSVAPQEQPPAPEPEHNSPVIPQEQPPVTEQENTKETPIESVNAPEEPVTQPAVPENVENPQ